MKYYFFPASLLLLFLLCSFSVSAAPQLYTFVGTVEFIEVDEEFLSDVDFDNDYSTPEDTITVGESVEYTFLVDFDLPGTCDGPAATTYSNICTGNDIPDSDTANYFYVELVSASKLATPTEEDTTFNFGLSQANLGWLVGDSAVFIISSNNIPVEQWVADSVNGTLIQGIDAWARPDGTSPYGRISSSLMLVSIEPVVMEAPVEHVKCKRRDGKHHRHHNKGFDGYYSGEEGAHEHHGSHLSYERKPHSDYTAEDVNGLQKHKHSLEKKKTRQRSGNRYFKNKHDKKEKAYGKYYKRNVGQYSHSSVH